MRRDVREVPNSAKGSDEVSWVGVGVRAVNVSRAVRLRSVDKRKGLVWRPRYHRDVG
jgi:hypothetical protein